MAEFDVLVVDAVERQRGKVAFLLRASGYSVDVAGTFEVAREKIARYTPKCVITSVRLGPYNGLHLIARTRHLDNSIAFVLTHDTADPVLKLEAHSFDVALLVLPCPGEVLANAVGQAILSLSNSSDLSISQRKVNSGEDSKTPSDLTVGANH